MSVEITSTYRFTKLPGRQQEHLTESLRNMANHCPYSLSPFGGSLSVERIWGALVMTKRLRGQPLSPDEQRWWASRQEQLLDPTNPTYVQLVADQWGITQDVQYRRRLDEILDNVWIAPEVRRITSVIITDTYQQLCVAGAPRLLEPVATLTGPRFFTEPVTAVPVSGCSTIDPRP